MDELVIQQDHKRTAALMIVVGALLVIEGIYEGTLASALERALIIIVPTALLTGFFTIQRVRLSEHALFLEYLGYSQKFSLSEFGSYQYPSFRPWHDFQLVRGRKRFGLQDSIGVCERFLFSKEAKSKLAAALEERGIHAHNTHPEAD